MALLVVAHEPAPDRMLGEFCRLAAYDALYLDRATRHRTALGTTDLDLRTAARKLRVTVLPN